MSKAITIPEELMTRFLGDVNMNYKTLAELAGTSESLAFKRVQEYRKKHNLPPKDKRKNVPEVLLELCACGRLTKKQGAIAAGVCFETFDIRLQEYLSDNGLELEPKRQPPPKKPNNEKLEDIPKRFIELLHLYKQDKISRVSICEKLGIDWKVFRRWRECCEEAGIVKCGTSWLRPRGIKNV